MDTNIVISIVVTLLSGVVGAFIGTYFGAFFTVRRQEKRLQEVRQMALKAIEIFKSYAHGGKTYDETSDQFNNSMSVSEKRTVVVALHKVGIPIQVLSNESFCISKVSFARQVIDKEDLDAIASQIGSGHCDTLFHIDPEKYFDDNIRQKSLRSVAKRWVQEVLVNSNISEDRKTVTYPKDWFRTFSLGERYVLCVIKERISTEEYFNSNAQIDDKKIADLLRDIDCGLWDNCLYWDYINYRNAVNTNQMAERLINNSQATIINL